MNICSMAAGKNAAAVSKAPLEERTFERIDLSTGLTVVLPALVSVLYLIASSM